MRAECKGCLGTFCKGCHGTEQKHETWGTPDLDLGHPAKKNFSPL